MDIQGLVLRSLLVLMYAWNTCTFVIMESDSTDASTGPRDIEERVVYLINVLHKVRDLTNTKSNTNTQKSDFDTNFDDMELPDTDDEDIDDWLRSSRPIKKAYEHVIDIQKKDYSILPPANEWCRMMGFRRCRSNRT